MLLILATLIMPLVARPALAQDCRLALVLALDVSGSVNEIEYRQQLEGLGAALDDPEVRRLILSGGAHVNLAAFEWSSRNHQFIIQPWIRLDSHAAIDTAAARIRTYQKRRAGLKTALSTAMLFAAEMLRDQGRCWKHTIDVSGDGRNNIGPELAQVYGVQAFAGVTVNALVVGDPTASRRRSAEGNPTKEELLGYFRDTVIRGPGAFALIAEGYPDYARAMRMKLLRELRLPVLGAR
jgi:hypothetical protein